MPNAKPIKTDSYYTGNKYGRITKGSAVTSCYSLQVGNEIACKDFFSTLRGAKFAAACFNAGVTEDQLSKFDCDIEAQVASMCPESKRKERLDEAVAKQVAKQES